MDTGKKIAERKDRWKSFLAGEGPEFLFVVRMAGGQTPPITRFWPGHEDVFMEHAWRGYQEQIERVAWLDDDLVPYLNCTTGTEIFAEAFGCEVHRPEHTAPFALHKITTAAEADKLRTPDLGSSSLMRFFDMAERLHRRARPDATLKIVDVQSPMDIAALIWEKTEFMMALFDAPDAVKALSHKVRDLLTAFFDEWFKRFGTEYVAHCPDYFISGGLTLSEDEVGCVNPEQFEEFFLDELVFLSKRYGGLGMHCCADSRHQWSSFKKIPGLRLLNLCCPPTRKGSEFICDALRLFSGTCSQWPYGWTPAGPVGTWPTQYPAGARMVIEAAANTKEEAIAICDALKRVRATS